MKKLLTAASALYLTFSNSVYAALPTAPAPSNNADEGNMLEWLQGLATDGITLIALLLSAAGFVWLSWIALSEINQARSGRKEWGEVGVTIVGGAIVYLFVSYMLGQAVGIF